MKNEDYEILRKAYEQLNGERPDIYVGAFEEQVTRLEMLFLKDRFIQMPKDKKAATAIVWLGDGDAMMKYYQAFKVHDMELLNDVLFETAQLLQIGNIMSPDTDHGYFGMKVTPNLMAANLMDRIKLLLPEENGIAACSYVGASIANLLMAILYDNVELKSDALKIAETELNKKNKKYCKLYIECMKAILQCDYETFNEKINLFCKAYMGVKEYGFNDFNRRFCIEAHGMYNLAKYAFDGAMRDKIALPAADNFCQELAVWQEEHNFCIGKIHYVYPEKLDFYNRLMHSTPVQMHLIKKGRKNYIDTDRYLEDIISVNQL